ncbi:Holliday junction branch migration protein RuvA [candidate division KSB1 bacterium 4484_188]|nr:MAG: Holliday junction branch migration protein RuvA [candidate division KSB1 bacterium 4484_188]HFE63670.1 Holliday junction branch migration protein RuvA [Caldithrix sp.]
MIEEINGRIIQKSPAFCVVECGGIGIGVFISVNTFQKLPDTGDSVHLLTHLHVREDLLQLYGFSGEDERKMFRLLINVGGIGPRLAMTILSGITVAELIQAIAGEDHQVLVRVPGVGKKTAQRMVLELKEKIEIPEEMKEFAGRAVIDPQLKGKMDEAILALTTLGYRQAEAKIAIEKILRKSPEDLPVDELIKLALRNV